MVTVTGTDANEPIIPSEVSPTVVVTRAPPRPSDEADFVDTNGGAGPDFIKAVAAGRAIAVDGRPAKAMIDRAEAAGGRSTVKKADRAARKGRLKRAGLPESFTVSGNKCGFSRH
jgi:hypothetical protein